MSVQTQIDRINSAKTAILAALTEKGVDTSGAGLADIAALVETITTGVDTSDATAAADKILSGYTAYVKGSKVTGTIASQGAQTITPGTSDKTIASGKYLSGTQTIKGDANLKAENIAKGVSIFGVAGSLEAGGGSGGTGSGVVASFGVVKPASDTKFITISHGLGVAPNLVSVHTPTTYGRTYARLSGFASSTRLSIGAAGLYSNSYNECYNSGSSNNTLVRSYNGGNILNGPISSDSTNIDGAVATNANEETFDLGAQTGTTQYYFRAGVPILWIVVRIER